MQVLSIRGLVKRYGGIPVVDGIDLAVDRGECFGLLGPNGAGKTTTLRLALGLIEPDGGTVHLLGFPVPKDAAKARTRVGVVPEVDNLDPDFTVRENLLAYGRCFGLKAAELDARLPRLLDFAGLAQRAHAPIATLSGGMKRRLTLARALVNDPEVVFLDEPTTGLDPQARHLIWEGLRRLIKEGKTLILTTHFMDEAQRLCDRLAIMDHGRVIAEGPPSSLILRHIEPVVIEIYGEGSLAWQRKFAARCCNRFERAGETLFCYTADPEPVLDALRGADDVRFLHRPANLEDVFLKLTGRELRE